MEPNLVDEFQSAFQSCIAACTNQDYLNYTSTDELKTTIEHSVHRYLEVARKLEAYFLQQRLVLSINRPEQLIKEDINEMKQEIQRKEALIQKHDEQLLKWIKVLNQTGQPTLGTSSISLPNTSNLPQAASNMAALTMNSTHVGNSLGPSIANPKQVSTSNVPPSGATLPSKMARPNTQGMGVIPGVQHSSVGQGNVQQNPLAYLEKTTSNIGIIEQRR